MNLRIGFSHLSLHAQQRLLERTKLKPSELIELLDNYSFISLGIETGFNREHCLIYCCYSERYFVAVQDIKTGTVTTVLPLEYHKNLSWRLGTYYKGVDEQTLDRIQVISSQKLHRDEYATNINLKVRYIDETGKLKVDTIKKFKASGFEYEPENVIKNEKKVRNLFSRWLKKKALSEVIDVFSSMGKSASPKFCSNDLVEDLNASLA